MELMIVAILFAVSALFILCFSVIWYNLLLSPPQYLRGTWKDDRVVLTWQAIDAIGEYEVFYRPRGSGETAQWSSLSSERVSMVEITVITGIYYDVYVIAKNWVGSSKRSVVIYGCARATAPAQLIAVCDASKPSISLKWSQVSCSTGYIIKRKAMTENKFRVIQNMNSSSITQMQDTSIIYGVSYTYIVISLDRSGESDSSPPTIASPRVPPPSHLVASTPPSLSATILLKWQPVPNSIAYHIYRRRSEDPIVQNPTAFTVLRNPNANSYLDQTAINKVKYTYTIASEDSAGVSSLSTPVTGIAVLTAPKNLTVEPVHGNASIILSWTEVAGTSGYRIWRTEGHSGTEEEVGLLSHEFNTKYVDRKAKYMITYSYMVQTFDKTTQYGPKSNRVKATVFDVTPSSDRQKNKQEATEHPMIDVRFGDLITEKADAIVVCLSSDELKKNVCKAAGQDTSLIVDDAHRRDTNGCSVISGGLLSCKNIIFVPWKGPKGSLDMLEQSIRTFVTIALQCAQQHECNTVSFSAVGEYGYFVLDMTYNFQFNTGCGGLGYDIDTVAKAMISETYKQLTTALWNRIQVSFIIHHTKQNIYDEFFRHVQWHEKLTTSTSIQHPAIPSTWQMTNSVYNLRMNVVTESEEGQLVLSDFRRTMVSGTYQLRIIRIERVQNERWFHQYQIHKREFDRRLQEETEQRLYHGCADGETAVKSITEHGFNRSLAGTQHGTAYGLGVYFSSKASESHGYARLSNGRSTEERYMFVCKVLVGKTIQGDSTMRMCPSGYDSTSNGSTIYVVYHDAQVYAEYLIVYK